MAKVNEVATTLTAAPAAKPAAVSSVESLLKMPGIRNRFEEMLGKKAAGFMSSIISAVSTNSALKTCDPRSVVASAAVAASLDLPINPSLGFAHIVPYSGKAQFQMGWKGFVQLGMRSGQYKSMNCSEVYEDELDTYNPITGEFKLKDQSEWKQRYNSQREKIVGFVSFFKLLNGFEMFLYMTKAQVEAHGREYSKSYGRDSSPWKTKFDAMAKKTVMKLLLSKFGVLSIEMTKALQTDQAVVIDENRLEFADNPNNQQGIDLAEVSEVETVEAPPANTEQKTEESK